MKIPINSNILSISHNDMDGVGCQILLGAMYPNITYVNVGYKEIDAHVMDIDASKYDFIFITDISPSIPELLYEYDNVIVIDHHQNLKNDPSRNIFINTTKSATYLVHHFLTRKYGSDIMDKYTKLVTIINDYDMWILKYKGSHALNVIYNNYHANKFRDRFASGKLKFTKYETDYVKSINDKFDVMFDELEVFDLDSINACYFLADAQVNEISHRLLHDGGYDVVLFNTMSRCNLSIRTKARDFNLGAWLKSHDLGGGHKGAGGIAGDTLDELNDNLNLIEDLVYEEIPAFRKVD